ncbi:MAG: hypothetical protein M5U26_19165 [Planctomycetota bacterium]|nr:hypothetical protein [Planctomycetota bacterium]
MGACYKCGEPFLSDAAVPVDAVCQKCSSWLHACANCLHYDEYAKNKCREARAPFVFDRQGKNECAYFRFKIKPLQDDKPNKKMSPRAEEKMKESKARDALNNLFRS